MSRPHAPTRPPLLTALPLAVLIPLAAPPAAGQSVLDEGAYELTLSEVPDIEEGKAVILQGEADADGDRYFIEQLQITQPVSVVLMAPHPDRPLELNLSKYRFDETDRSGRTDASGSVAFHFRTQGELKIHVKPVDPEEAAPAPYFLIAWAGDEVVPELPPPVVLQTGSVGGGGGIPGWLLALGGVVAALAVGISIGRKRGAGSGTGTIVLLLGAGLALAPASALAQARQVGSVGAMRGAVEAMEWEGEDAADRRALNEAGRNAVDSGLGHLNTGMSLYDASRGFTEADATLDDVLNPDDLEFDPDYSPEGSPELPVHCATEGGADCQCYADAYAQLSFVRFYLEKLRAIYGATKNYTDNAIAFGDAMAGVGGGFGMAWPPERRGIQEAFENLGRTYDRRYEGYMRELREALDAIAACEAEHHGVEDWYSRFGFIYFTFMQDRYRR